MFPLLAGLVAADRPWVMVGYATVRREEQGPAWFRRQVADSQEMQVVV